MRNRILMHGRRRPWIIALIAVVTLLAAACGGDEGGGGGGQQGDGDAGGIEEARQLLEEDMAPVSWVAPGPELDVGTQLEGKTLCTVSITLANEFGEAIITGTEEAAEAVGMEVVPQDAEGSVTNANRLMDQCITRKADVIAIHSFPTEAITASIEKAADAGVHVIQLFEGLGPVPPEHQDVGVSARVSFDYENAGRRLARFVVADSGGDANVIVFDVPEIGVSALERDGFIDELERLCPDCSAEVVDAPVAQWQTGLQNTAASAMRANPDADYLFPLFDGMVLFVKPAVFQQGKEDSVKIVSYNADLASMESVAKGDDPEVTAVGGPNEWVGWATIDQAARLILGEEPVDDHMIPHRTFTIDNIGEADLSQPSYTWYGDEIDFKSEFRALWGLA